MSEARRTIFIARHGETEQNAARVIQLPGVRLSATGRAQAQRLAERMAAAEIRRIVVSDLARAIETADYISYRTGLPLELEPLLQERNFGDLRGVPYSELTSDPFAPDYVPPNGESWAAFHARVARAWECITRNAAETAGHLLVLTHGLVCRALLERHAELASGERAPASWANTGISEIEGVAPWRVRKAHCVAHLAALPAGSAPV